MVRFKNRKQLVFLLVWAFVLSVHPIVSHASTQINDSVQNVAKVEVTGDNVNLRDAPSAKGKVLGQALKMDSFS